MKAKNRFWRMLRIVAGESRRAATTPWRSPLSSVTPALSIATSVPVPIAIADVGGGERRRVVDAVAGHRDDPALLTQPLNHPALVLRQDFRLDLGDAELARDRFGRRAIVAGQHDDAHARVLAARGRRPPSSP